MSLSDIWFSFVVITVPIGGIFCLFVVKLWYSMSTRRCHSVRLMTGKTVIVTGSNTGIGKETALDLARRGARVYLACRDESRGLEARDEIIRSTDNKDVHFLQLDLASLASIRRFAAEVKRREKQLHVLINNAAAAKLPSKLTEDGLQHEMQINHFGPFLLTHLLIDLLKQSAPSRIVIVSSFAHNFARLELDNLNFEKSFSHFYQYNNSKLANILFSNELARRLQGTGVTCNSLNPGIVNTSFFRWMRPLARVTILPMIGFLFKTPEDGAQTSIYLAVSEDVENDTGKYFVDCKEEEPSVDAQDEKLAHLLWDKCLELVKLGPTEICC